MYYDVHRSETAYWEKKKVGQGLGSILAIDWILRCAGGRSESQLLIDCGLMPSLCHQREVSPENRVDILIKNDNETYTGTNNLQSVHYNAFRK